MSKIIALASADWHIHKFRDFDNNGSRLDHCINAAQDIMNRASSLNVPLLFAGDLIHSPKNIETETNVRVQRLFDPKLNPINIIAISGNHDMSERNTLDSISPSHLDSIRNPNFIVLSGTRKSYIKGATVWGIPYMNNPEEFKEIILKLSQQCTMEGINWGLKILLLHSDMPGAKTPEGFVIGEVQSIPNHLDEFFKDWDLVLCGHIHKPQKLSQKCYMLGCHIQQNMGNRHDALGYWEVYSNATMKFVPLDNYPKFIQLKKGEEPKDDFNYYVPFGEVLEDEEIETGEFNINYSKKRLAATYLKKKNIKSKSKKRALIKILNEE